MAWTRGHQINVLVSHQPTDWLHPASLEAWNSEIFPPGRFDVHLFGHMHEHAARSTVKGGSLARREIRAASIFGLETIGGKQKRAHGYAVAQIGGSDGVRALTVWPRTLRTMSGGERKLVADQLQELTEDNNFSWPLSATPAPPTTAAAHAEHAPRLTISEVGRPGPEAVARIERLRYHLPAARAHEAVRGIEREEADAHLGSDGILWISCDWGLGEDGFMWSLFAKRGESETPIYRLDLQDFQDREQFLTGVAAELGCSFEQFCEHLSDLDSSLLLLDSVPSPVGRRPGERPPERDLEELCDIVREYAPSVRVVLRGKTHAGGGPSRACRAQGLRGGGRRRLYSLLRARRRGLHPTRRHRDHVAAHQRIAGSAGQHAARSRGHLAGGLGQLRTGLHCRPGGHRCSRHTFGCADRAGAIGRAGVGPGIPTVGGAHRCRGASSWRE